MADSRSRIDNLLLMRDGIVHVFVFFFFLIAAIAIGASVVIFVLIVVVVATALPIGVAVIICRDKKNKTHVQQPDEAHDIQHSDTIQPSIEIQYPNNAGADTR